MFTYSEVAQVCGESAVVHCTMCSDQKDGLSLSYESGSRYLMKPIPVHCIPVITDTTSKKPKFITHIRIQEVLSIIDKPGQKESAAYYSDMY